MVTRILRDDPGKATMHNVTNVPLDVSIPYANQWVSLAASHQSVIVLGKSYGL